MVKVTDEAVLAAMQAWSASFPVPMYEEVKEMLSAALPHLQAGYAVKQLEWGKLLYTEDYNFMQSAETSIGKYVATDSGWFLQGQSDWNGADCIETAKAAAQADFERRVLDCIDADINEVSITKSSGCVFEDLGVDVAAVRRQAFEEAFKILEHEAHELGGLVDDVSYHLMRKAKIIRSLSAEPVLEAGQ